MRVRAASAGPTALAARTMTTASSAATPAAGITFRSSSACSSRPSTSNTPRRAPGEGRGAPRDPPGEPRTSRNTPGPRSAGSPPLPSRRCGWGSTGRTLPTPARGPGTAPAGFPGPEWAYPRPAAARGAPGGGPIATTSGGFRSVSPCVLELLGTEVLHLVGRVAHQVAEVGRLAQERPGVVDAVGERLIAFGETFPVEQDGAGERVDQELFGQLLRQRAVADLPLVRLGDLLEIFLVARVVDPRHLDLGAVAVDVDPDAVFLRRLVGLELADVHIVVLRCKK